MGRAEFLLQRALFGNKLCFVDEQMDTALDWKLIAALVERSYRRVASKQSLALLDSGKKRNKATFEHLRA